MLVSISIDQIEERKKERKGGRKKERKRGRKCSNGVGKKEKQ